MPIEQLHKEKRTKNYLLFALLVAFMAALFYISLIKIKLAGA